MNSKKKYTSVFTAITFSILLSGGLFPFMEAQAGGSDVIAILPSGVVEPSGELAYEFEGHCYAFIPDFPSWIDALNDAPTKSVNGNPGHLVTISSQAEDDFVDWVSASKSWIGYTSDTNFHQPATPIDGDGFAWINAEPTVFTNWNPGEPNNAAEMYVETHQGAGAWNDSGFSSANINGYFVEFESCLFVGGEFLSIDSTALLLAGAQTNAVWIMSALAVIGSVAFGALYITSKRK